MFQQYLRIKEQHPDSVLFFRNGDFYEMFFEDAEVGARDLDIVLTGRDGGGGKRIPMAGIPFHACESYLARLIQAGHKVAICEQVEDPAAAKGLVRREVVRVVTPGTVVENRLLGERSHNYLAAVYLESPTPRRGSRVGLAVLDVSTGDFFLGEEAGDDPVALTRDWLARYHPAECLLDPGASSQGRLVSLLSDGFGAAVRRCEERSFLPDRAHRLLTEHFQTLSLEGFGCAGYPLGIRAAGAALAYVRENYRALLPHIDRLSPIYPERDLILDGATRRHLELTRNSRDGGRKGTLLWVLDHARTAGGSRCLSGWLETPLRRVEEIRERQGAVQRLVDDAGLRSDLAETLTPLPDMDRLLARLAAGTGGPRDAAGLGEALALLPAVKQLLLPQGEAGTAASGMGDGGGSGTSGGDGEAAGGAGTAHGAGTSGGAGTAGASGAAGETGESMVGIVGNAGGLLERLAGILPDLQDIADLLRSAIAGDPPALARSGGFIRDGFSAELDGLRSLRETARSWMASLEAREKEATGIKSLRVGYNKVFGYYLEVTRANLVAVPSHYQRRQTLVNAERFVTEELLSREEEILAAEEKTAALEARLWDELVVSVIARAREIRAASRVFSQLDALYSLAQAAVENGYIRPEVNEGDRIEVVGGRHPVLGKAMAGRFVPNDVLLDDDQHRMLIITGPNMAGKSTYLRQVALLVLMAQAGSFIPAERAVIGAVDRIFSRIGAGDDLFSGQSTFMVEMQEVANILHHAGPRSLVILDEVGRGTSTFDGMSVARSVIRYLHDPDQCGARTLFATHYHELTDLDRELEGVRNFSFAVREMGEEIVFLHRLVTGAADHSLGVQVARLAGLPRAVVEEAARYLAELEAGKGAAAAVAGGEAAATLEPGPESGGSPALRTAQVDTVMVELAALDPERLTPLEALALLFRWKKRAGRFGDQGGS